MDETVEKVLTEFAKAIESNNRAIENNNKVLMEFARSTENSSKKHFRNELIMILVIPITIIGVMAVLYLSNYKGPTVEQKTNKSETTQKIN